MNQKEIQDLIKLINKTDISEFKLKDKDFSISIRTKNFPGKKSEATVVPIMQQAAPMASMPAPAATVEATAPTIQNDAPAVTETQEDTSKYQTIKSPMVGTFFRKPAPDKEPFVKVGDNISSGDILCVVEAMKLFNEIESEVSGTIVKVLVDDSSPVEYDQPLFLIDPA